MNRKRNFFLWYWGPVLLMLSIILVESTAMMGGGNTLSVLEQLLRAVHISLNESQAETLNHILRKTGHCVGYATLCYVFFRLLRQYDRLRQYAATSRWDWKELSFWFKPRVAAYSLFLTAMVATADEVHQMTLPGRTGVWSDVLLDSTAALVFLLFMYMVDRWRLRRRMHFSPA